MPLSVLYSETLHPADFKTNGDAELPYFRKGSVTTPEKQMMIFYADTFPSCPIVIDKKNFEGCHKDELYDVRCVGKLVPGSFAFPKPYFLAEHIVKMK